MKQILLVLGVFALCSLPLSIAKANEDVTQVQEIANNQAYGTLNLQKQPQKESQRQGISNHFTFFTINVQINGKIKDYADNNAN